MIYSLTHASGMAHKAHSQVRPDEAILSRGVVLASRVVTG